MNKSTVAAVVVFVALAAAAFATLREKPERGITRVSFASIDPAKVDRVVIKGEQPIELVRDGEQWRIGAQRADGAAVERLLETVKRIESSDLVTRNPDRFAELEVNVDEGAEVQVFSGGAEVAEFTVGSAASGGSNVRVDDAVYLVKRVSKASFARERTQWLDRKLFADAPDAPSRVKVALAGRDAYALVKEGEEWKIEDGPPLPASFRFDRKAARALASTLASAQAKDVLEEDPGNAATGLDDAADTITFEAAGGEPRTLRLGKKRDDDGSVYARASTRSEVVTLPEHLARNLRKHVTDLRDLAVMDLDPAAAKRVEIVRDGNSLVLEKDGETWKVAESTGEAPTNFAFDPSIVSQRLHALRSARALGPAPQDVTAAQAGVEKPASRIAVTLADDRVVTLAFGAEAKHGETDGVYARGNADAETYVVGKHTRDTLLGGLETFAKRPDAGSPLAGIDPKALSNLPPEVRDSLMKQIQQKRAQDEAMRKAMEQAGERGAEKQQ